MPDIVSKKKRSEMMSGISSKNTIPELVVRSCLHHAGYRFRVHRSDLPGSPDIVMSKYKLVIFVNGCFWHRHTGCKFAYHPKTREEFWQNKFLQNVLRDEKNILRLLESGWKVLIIWECFLKKKNKSFITEMLENAIHSEAEYYELPLTDSSEIISLNE